MSEEKPVILTVDAAVIVDDKDIVLIRRAIEPFLDKLVLPGGHAETKEKAAEAAARELLEETGIRVEVKLLQFLLVLDEPDRDPRPDASRVSLAYVARVKRDATKNMKAASDAKSLVVRSLMSLTEDEMGFDHWQTIKMLQKDIEERQSFWNETNENGFPKHVCPRMADEQWEGTVEIIYAIDPDSAHEGAFLESTSALGDEFSEPIHFCPVCGRPCHPPVK